MDHIIGIDLGTTNSAVAYLAADGPKLIVNAVGNVLTPSVVGIGEDGCLLIGEGARELQVIHPERCASLFKRHMGSDRTTRLCDRSFTPEELSSLILGSLRSDAENLFQTEVRRAVISVPAYFNDRQRKATMVAGRIAGLTVERIINEPTAAAIAHGFHESKFDKTLLIFDLGGGTFDVSVVEIFEGTLEVRASCGENFLGGEDFTRTIAARLLEARGIQFERAEALSPAMVSRLIQQSELAKRRLSREDSAVVRIPESDGGLRDDSPTVEILREQYERWIEPTLARIEMPLRRVLGDAKLDRNGIDEIILVGGATRTPIVVERLEKQFGKPIVRRLNPDEVVALGAAVQGGLIGKNQAADDMVVTDVAPFTLGVEIAKRLGGAVQPGYFLPVIHRNTTIPVSRMEQVATVFPNQTSVTVKIFQGESRRVEDNLCLGEFQLPGIPQGPLGQCVDLRFTYDLNGILEVEATISATGRKVSHIVTKNARGLSAEEIRNAVAEMSMLKLHPREEAAHRLLLRRAERLYRELPMIEREQLSMLLDGFESALKSGDKSAIAGMRESLIEFLGSIEPEPPEPDC